MVSGFHSFSLLGFVAAGWPLVVLLALLALPHFGAVGWRTGGVIFLFVFPPAALVLISLVAPHSIFDPRYLTVAVPPLYVLAGRALGGLVPRSLCVAVAALIPVCSGLALWQNQDPSNPKLYQLREAVHAASAHSRSGDVLVLAPELMSTPVLEYYRPSGKLVGIDTTSPEQAWQRIASRRARRVFLITSFENAAAGREETAAYRRYFAARSTAISTREFVNVTLRVYTLRRSKGAGGP
jgi:hypothetical protein